MKRILSLVLALTLVGFVPAFVSCEPDNTETEQPGNQPTDPSTPDTPADPDPTTPTDPTEPIDPVEPSDGIIRILAIGNSFSQDAVEQYLYELFEAAGTKVIIGNMYIGGCSLEKHWSNASSDAEAYYYRKIVDGVKKETQSVKLSTALADEKWDYVSLQQVSGQSGIYSSYSPHLENMVNYVKKHAAKSTVQLMLHQTWAYASSSTHTDFPKYDSDQTKMYKAIMEAVKKASEVNSISMVIPSGTSIQNARTTYLGDSFNRDGYHLEVTYGRYTAACAWYETISGKSVVGNTYHPSTVSSYIASLAQASAHAACQQPWSVTEMTEFKTAEIKDKTLAKPVQIDFGGGSTASPAGWNKVASATTDKDIFLTNTDGEYSILKIQSLSGFSGLHNGVGSEPDSEIKIGDDSYAKAVWSDGILVSGSKGAGNVGPAKIVISGFDPTVKYTIKVLAVRFNGSAAARECRYTVVGAAKSDEKSIFPGLKTFDATSGDFSGFQVVFSEIAPAADGTITLEVVGVDTTLAADGLVSAIKISK